MSDRILALASVLLLHAVVIYSLSHLFLYSSSRQALANLEVHVVPRAKPPVAQLTLPKVDLQESPPMELAPPEPVSELPPEPAPIPVETLPEHPIPPEIHAGTATSDGLEASGPLIGPRPISGPHSADFYPPQSILARERGRVAMIICISSSGNVDTVKLATSSGFPRLDDAGLNIAGKYRFKPAMRAGIPVPVCVRYQLNFRIDI